MLIWGAQSITLIRIINFHFRNLATTFLLPPHYPLYPNNFHGMIFPSFIRFSLSYKFDGKDRGLLIMCCELEVRKIVFMVHFIKVKITHDKTWANAYTQEKLSGRRFSVAWSALTFFTYTSLIKFANNIFCAVKIWHTLFFSPFCNLFICCLLALQPPWKGEEHFLNWKALWNVVADLEVTNNCKDCMQANKKEQYS